MCSRDSDAAPRPNPWKEEPRFRLARTTVRHAIRDQLERSFGPAPHVLEAATDEMLLTIARSSLAMSLLIVISPHTGVVPE